MSCYGESGTNPRPQMADRTGGEAVLEELRGGRFLDAYARWRNDLTLASPTDASSMLVASRVQESLYNQREQYQWILRARRHDRTHRGAWLEQAKMKLQRCGPWTAARFLKKRERDLNFPLVFDLQARIATAFRDFDEAHAHLDDWAASTPDDHFWIESTRVTVWIGQDRWCDAQAGVDRLRERYRDRYPIVCLQLQLLEYRDETEAAIELAKAHLARFQSPWLYFCLSDCLSRRQRWSEVLELLPKVEPFALLSSTIRGWAINRQLGALIALGRQVEALALAAKNPDQRMTTSWMLSGRSQDGNKSVWLTVPYLRQHHNYCSPATLAAATRFWGRTYSQEEIAKEIAYNGAPHHHERVWIEAAGFAAREFRVTWEATEQLLDAGVPFGITTVFPRGAHIALVVGYLARGHLLVISDPSLDDLQYVSAHEYLAEQRAFGPRGLAIVPRDQAYRIESISLPESGQYDLLHQIRIALEEGRRTDASALLEKLNQLGFDSDLAMQARLACHYKDRRPEEARTVLAAYLERYPDSVLVGLQYLAALKGCQDFSSVDAFLSTRQEQAEYWLEIGEKLLGKHPNASRLYALAVLRRWPLDSTALDLFARSEATRGDHRAAAGPFARATTLDDKNEARWANRFTNALLLGEADSVLELLRKRAKKLRERSYQPVLTLIAALEQLHQTSEAQEWLDSLADWLERDALLNKAAGDWFLQHGKIAQIAECIERLNRLGAVNDGLRLRAQLCLSQGDATGAKQAVQEALGNEPGALDLHQMMFDRLCQDPGLSEALEYLDKLLTDFPERTHLTRLALTKLTIQAPESAEEWTSKILPFDRAWCLRQLARIKYHLNGPSKALDDCRQALQMEPGSFDGWYLWGVLQAALNQDEEAKKAFIRAEKITPGTEVILGNRIALCRSRKERAAFLESAFNELLTRPFGNRLIITWSSLAYRVIPLERQGNLLGQYAERYPGNPAAREAWVRYLLQRDSVEEAKFVNENAIRVFSDHAPLYHLGAEIAWRQRIEDKELLLLEKANLIAPWQADSWIRVITCLTRDRKFPEAHELLKRALTIFPERSDVYRLAADLLWIELRDQEAISVLKQGLRFNPEDTAGWQRLIDWTDITDNQEEALAFARDQSFNDRPSPVAGHAAVLIRERQGAEPAELREAMIDLLQRYPRYVPGREYYLRLLFNEKRFSDVMLASRARSLPARPASLILWEAKSIFADGADRPAAETAAEAAELDPNLLEAWAFVTETGHRAGLQALAADAAAEWAHRNPNDANAWFWSGLVAKESGDLNRATKSLERAVRLQPRSIAIVEAAYELAKQAGEPAAEARLDQLSVPHWIGRFVECQRRIKLKQATRALDLFSQLIVDPWFPQDKAEILLAGLSSGRLRRRTKRIIEQALLQRESGALVPLLWLKLCSTHEIIRAVRRASLPEDGPVRDILLADLIQRARQTSSLDLLRVLARCYRQAIEDSPILSDQMAALFTDLNRSSLATEWLSRSITRLDATKLRYLLLAIGLLAQRRLEEASSAARCAITLPGAATTDTARVIMAFAELVRGNAAAFRNEILEVDKQRLGAFGQVLHIITERLLSFAETQAGQPANRGRRVAREFAEGLQNELNGYKPGAAVELINSVIYLAEKFICSTARARRPKLRPPAWKRRTSRRAASWMPPLFVRFGRAFAPAIVLCAFAAVIQLTRPVDRGYAPPPPVQPYYSQKTVAGGEVGTEPWKAPPSPAKSSLSDQTINDLGAKIAADPQNADLYITRAEFRENSDPRDALVDYGRAINVRPSDANAYQRRGELYSQLQQYYAAIEDFSKVIELAPGNIKTLLARGRLYLLKNDSKLAYADAIAAEKLATEAGDHTLAAAATALKQQSAPR